MKSYVKDRNGQVMTYDYLIVGSGLFGSVCAHELTKIGKTCLLIDKRPQYGGNVYTSKEEGIPVSKYGPHIFHTNDKKIWDYVNKFTEFNNYVNRVKAVYKDKLYSLPINLMTFYELWGIKTPVEAVKKLKEVVIPIENPKNFEEVALSTVGEEIYNTFFRGYTIKQWQKDPKDLPAFILKRLPYRLNFDDNYFIHKYQGMPANGYTEMMSNIIKDIPIELNVDFFSEKLSYWKNIGKKIIYTGKIDTFFNYEFGELEYLGVNFEETTYDVEDYQGNAVINYTDIDVPYTRSTEHKHFYDITSKKTIVTREYPIKYEKSQTPYYPIYDEKNKKMYLKYKEIANKDSDIHFGGRLGDFKYYDMHQVIGSALAKVRNIV